jgi:Ca2+-binding RTX toxin-like protein
VNYGAGTAGLRLFASNTGTATLNASGSATTDVLDLTNINGNQTHGAFITTGFETINLSSTRPATTTSTHGAITMTATAAPESLVISGAAAIVVGAVTADIINASTLTGALTMTASSANAAFFGAPVTAAGVQITGGSGNDSLFGSDGADQIVGGAGNDTLRLGSAGASQGDIVTGGAGADQFRFDGATQSGGTSQIVRITDFVTGTDKIGIFFGSMVSATMNTAVTIGTADTLAQIYASAGPFLGSTGVTLAAKVVTVSAGLAAGTYLFLDGNRDNANNGGTAGTDLLINITGVTGTVTATDFVFG